MAKIVHESTITIPAERQRDSIDPGDLLSLSEQIDEVGILNPPAVQGSVLRAGEHRLRAMRILILKGKPIKYGGETLPLGMIPINDLGDISDVTAFAAELYENIGRVDLSWQAKAKSIQRLAELKAALAEAKGEPAPTRQELAQDAFPSSPSNHGVDAVRKSLAVAAMLHDPDVKKASNLNDAFKVVLRKEEQKRFERLGVEFRDKPSDDRYTIVQADAREWLPTCPKEAFDCVLIDPPYGMGADTFGDAAGRLSGIEHSYTDSPEHFRTLLEDIAPELVRVMKVQSHLYIWCDIDRFHFLKLLFNSLGLWVHRTPLINIKREGGRVPWPEHGPRRCYELVLYAVKGKRPTLSIQRDTFESTLDRDTDGHGAAKPVEAYVNLLRRTCRPGDSVLDCFAGTGTIIPAAHELELRATAIELDSASYGRCLSRVEGLAK